MTAVTSDGTRRTLFFDANSYLLVKDEQETDADVEKRYFDDYRRVGLVMEPHRIEWHRNGETLQIAVERVTHNAALDDQTFDVPLSADEPRLDVDAVLSAAARAGQRANPLRTAYAYTRTTSSGRMDERVRNAVHEYERQRASGNRLGVNRRGPRRRVLSGSRCCRSIPFRRTAGCLPSASCAANGWVGVR